MAVRISHSCIGPKRDDLRGRNKKPRRSGVSFLLPAGRPGYGYLPPATALKAFLMAFGLDMMFMKLFLPIIFRSG